MDNEIKTNENDVSNEVSFNTPTIVSPRPGATVTPGFLIQATYPTGPSSWKVQIRNLLHGVIHEHIQSSGPYLNYRAPNNLMGPETIFYLKVQFAAGGHWSSAATSSFLTMGIEKPVINPPSQASTNKPLVFGRGYPGATVKLVQAGYGGVVHGSGVVDANGEWRVQVTEPLWAGEFPMTANQTFNKTVSDWAQTVTFVVRP